MPNIPKNLVPARYIGNHAVELVPGLIYYNIDGTRRRNNTLEHGDTLMMRDEDVFGKTIWHDPHRQQPSRMLGIGRVVLPEHVNLSEEELSLAGYEWHEGRSDFQAIEAPPQTKQTIIPDSIKAEQVVADDGEENIIETPEPTKEEEKSATSSEESEEGH